MVQLVPMTESEFREFLEADIRFYADEHVKEGNWHPSEALERSRKEHERLLPDGLATKNAYLFSIVDRDKGNTVGMIWFSVDDQRPIPTAFVYLIEIYQTYRRKGYATQTMQALVEKAKSLGVNQIDLHVFGANHAAQDLYAKTGFEVTGILMRKHVA